MFVNNHASINRANRDSLAYQKAPCYTASNHGMTLEYWDSSMMCVCFSRRINYSRGNSNRQYRNLKKVRAGRLTVKLRPVGFFKELDHGFPAGPSLAESKRSLATSDEAKIKHYLNSATTFIASPGLVRDVLNPGKPIGTASILTDGVWAWPADLSYYVSAYHVELPTDFLSFMRMKGWDNSSVDEAILETLEL